MADDRDHDQDEQADDARGDQPGPDEQPPDKGLHSDRIGRGSGCGGELNGGGSDDAMLGAWACGPNCPAELDGQGSYAFTECSSESESEFGDSQ